MLGSLVERIERASGMTAVDFERATGRRTAMWQIVREFFEQGDMPGWVPGVQTATEQGDGHARSGERSPVRRAVDSICGA